MIKGMLLQVSEGSRKDIRLFLGLVSFCYGTLTYAAGPAVIELPGVSTEVIDPLFTNPDLRPKVDSVSGEEIPAEVIAEYVTEFTALAPGEDNNRGPASAKRKGKTLKGKKQVSKSSAPASGSNRLPSSVSDGFELRLRQGQQVSRFWVLKREGRHDFVFVNSSGSQTSLAIPAETFHFLQSAAQEIKAAKSEISRCPAASMELHVVSTGKAEKTLDACITSKTKSAQSIRTLSGLLASFVR